MKVYIPQMPARYDQASRVWIPTIDIEPAKDHGEIVIVTPSSVSRLSVQDQMDIVTEAMMEFTSDDFIIMVGDPFSQALVVATASHITGGRFRILKWDRFTHEYREVPANLNFTKKENE